MTTPKTYLYEQIIEKLIVLIEERGIEIGDRLPSERELAELFDCNYHTIRKAVALMIEQQLVERTHGSGTYLRTPVEELRICKSRKVSFRPTNLLGMVLQPDIGHFASTLLVQLIKSAEQRNLKLEIYPLSSFDENSLLLPQRMLDQGCQAVIIPMLSVSALNPCIEEFIVRCQMPLVCSARAGTFQQFNFQDQAEAGITARREMRFACRYFQELGYRRIVYLAPRMAAYNPSFAKEEEYLTFMYQNQLPVHLDYLNKDFREVDAVIRRLEPWRAKTAIICFDDDYALRLMTSLYKRGFAIPDDFALMGCNNIDEAAYSEPALSTIQFPYAYLAESMIDEALSRLDGGKRRHAILPEPEVIVRHSCGGRKMLKKELEPTIARIKAEVCSQLVPHRTDISAAEKTYPELALAQ